MAFPDSIVRNQFQLQGGHCAVCGLKMAWGVRGFRALGGWQAHHIDGDDLNDSSANCACVCANDNRDCHLDRCHFGDMGGALVLDRSGFPNLGRR